MRVYQAPPDTKDKEKIIGGILNINQFFWLLGGFLLGIFMFIVLIFAIRKAVVGGIVGGIVGVLSFIASFPFAFYKKMDLPLWTYITRKRKFKNKTHKLINKRKDVKI